MYGVNGYLNSKRDATVSGTTAAGGRTTRGRVRPSRSRQRSSSPWSSRSCASSGWTGSACGCLQVRSRRRSRQGCVRCWSGARGSLGRWSGRGVGSSRFLSSPRTARSASRSSLSGGRAWRASGTGLEAESATIEAEIMVRAAPAIDVAGTIRGLCHLGDVFDEVEDTAGRYLNRVVARRGALDLHVLAHLLILSSVEPSRALDAILGTVGPAAAEEALQGGNGVGFACRSGGKSSWLLAVGERQGAPAASLGTPSASARALRPWSRSTGGGYRGRCSTG